MILVTGGLGYIGSHTLVALSQIGQTAIVLDNLSNSRVSVLDRLAQICGVKHTFIEGDIRDSELLDRIFKLYAITAVIHFAGLKAVGESVEKPLEYFDNNIQGTLSLLNAMQRANVKTFIFSSSATVYGNPEIVPISEDAPRSATNPYGRSKLIVEDILGDLYTAERDWRIAILRYFNPVGAHISGLIGENPKGTPNNLMPFIAQVAAGLRDKLSIFGGDYPTVDGTGVRDYIHVMDLAEGHIAALKYCQEVGGVLTTNLGTGVGYSVLDMVKAFTRASQKLIPYEIVNRRNGDVAQCWANISHAEKVLGWRAQLGLDSMCEDGWRWQQKNVKGLE